MAAVAGASGSNGSFTASSLAPSGTWAQTGPNGGFSWTYPIATPSAGAGADVAPDVALSYNSTSVDGRVATTNNQTSQIGEGWDYSPGFIERTYRTCSDDTTLPAASQTADLCWAGQILTYSLNGSSNAIVRDDQTGNYRLKNDDGSRLELLGTSPTGGAGEYWRVTDTSGTQYYFGLNATPGAGTATHSRWTVPVFGAHSGDPCNGSTFATSVCTQVWRWNLDFVVDTNQNATAYYYNGETNYYEQTGASSPVAYTRGGYLSTIDYGLRTTSSGNLDTTVPPADEVVFTSDERCFSNCGTFDTTHQSSWPDTPVDQNCDGSGTCSNTAPTFWTRKRLTTITTKYQSSSGLKTVDTYALGESFPTSGDPELELDSITRTATGADGSTITLAPVAFTYELLDNRVSGQTNSSQLPMGMWRLDEIDTETGEDILVSYDQAGRVPAQCTGTTLPSSPANNTSECFPVSWTPFGSSSPILDYFHTYAVTEVDVDDANGTGVNRDTTYTYSSPAWHADDNEIVAAKYRTYGQFRGYQTVAVRTGNANHSSNGVADAWTLTKTTYLQGMGDTVTNLLGASVTDSDEFAGQTLQSQVYDGDSTTVVSAQVSTPESSVTATRARTGLPSLAANFVHPQSATTLTYLASGGPSSRTETYDYDGAGRVIHTTDSGTGINPLCTTTHYAENLTTWIRDRTSETIASAQVCPATDSGLANVLRRSQIYYDGTSVNDSPSTLGTVPGNGNATEYDTATTLSPVHWAQSINAYDALGRVSSTKAIVSPTDSRTTTTAYTPTDRGPVTQVKVTNPLSQSATTVSDPARGSTTESVDVAGHTTDATYDALGRLTATWTPGLVKGTDPAAVKYAYTYGPSAPLAVTTNRLVDPGNGATPGYITSVSIYDAFGTLRQTQAAAVGGGRVVMDSLEDGHGWVTQTNNHWFTTGAPATSLIGTTQSQIDDSTRTLFDGTGRPTLTTEFKGTSSTWSTKTVYSGDSVTVVPPAGGVETTTFNDVRNNTTETDRWTSAPTISGNVLSGGTAVKTTYQYDELGQQTSLSTGGSTWKNGYDSAGRQISSSDPDTGNSTMSYDDAGELTATTDAAGTSITTNYDKLGRQLSAYNGATELSSWLWDTLQPGELTSSTSYSVAHGNDTVSALDYDAAGRPTGSVTQLSAPDPGFASSYTTKTTWTRTGLLATMTPAAGGGLPAETLDYFYDAFGDPTSQTGVNAYVSSSTYSPYGEPTQYSLGINNQAAWLTYTLDPQTRRVTDANFSAQQATPQINDVAYTYDAAGNVSNTLTTEGGGTGAPTERQCYTYDALDQLTQAWSATDNCAKNPSVSGNATVGGAQSYWTTWSYDTAGGRTQQIQHPTPANSATTTTVYTNGVTTPQVHAHALASTQVGTTTTNSFVYDADGRTTSHIAGGTTSTFSYNPLGQTDTAKVTVSGAAAQSVNYSYDASGNTLLRRDPTATTLYLPGEELTYNGSTMIGIRYYTHNGLTVSMRKGNSNPIYIVSEAHGSADIEATTASTGINGMRRRYFDPFGNLLTNTTGGLNVTGGTWIDNHDYLNKPTDVTTKLDALGARQYDPTLGRFMSVDPVLEPGDAIAANGYTYADNNPVGNADPTGLTPCMSLPQEDRYGCEGGGSHGTTPPPAPAPSQISFIRSYNTAQDQMRSTIAAKAAATYTSGTGSTSIDLSPKEEQWTHYMGMCSGDVGACYVSYQIALGRNLTDSQANDMDRAVCEAAGLQQSCPKRYENMAGVVVPDAVGQMIQDSLVTLGAGAALKAVIGAGAAATADAADTGAGDLAEACANSFTADTPVTLADGKQEPISKVKVGDKVLATDPYTGQTKSESVVALIRHSGQHAMVLVTLADGSVLDATGGHRIWDAAQGTFVDASQLRAGDKIETSTGAFIAVASLTTYSAKLTAYNLQIDQIHTYYAGSTPVLVHNSCEPVVGPGASADNLLPSQASRIQAVADRLGRPVSVVGSRAAGTAGETSDWDYIIEGSTAKMRSTAKYLLPRNPGQSTDILNTTVDPSAPSITFYPGGG